MSQEIREVRWSRVWLHSMRAALRIMPAEPVLGWKRLILPTNYWRTREFSYVWSALRRSPMARVLDVGSPKFLAPLLAAHESMSVTSVDILREETDVCRRYATALGAYGGGEGRVRCVQVDARDLPFSDESFDAAYSVSVLEHIPGIGDSEAVTEMARVVKPGGKLVITVPFDSSYRETYVERDVYERHQMGSDPVFFERHYDNDALQRRIISPSGANVDAYSTWGERPWLRLEQLMNRLGSYWTPLSPIEPLLSRVALQSATKRRNVVPMAAFLTLVRD